MRTLILAAGLVLAAATAHAAAFTTDGHDAGMTTDFRTWNGADGKHLWTADHVTASAWRQGRHDPKARSLYQDGEDGLGVRRWGNRNDDEISGSEYLHVDVGGKKINKIFISDLFAAPDGNTKRGEQAKVRVGMGDGSSFTALAFGNHADQGNGELTIHIGDLVGHNLVSWMKFKSIGKGSDYSVAGMSEVPVPAAIWGLGAGLAGLAALRRRQHARA